MSDIVPQEVAKWQHIEDVSRRIFKRYNFKEIRTPIVESLGLFQRSIGQETDIVQKEMFQFQDRGGRDLVLRPEFTASVVRAYIQNQLKEGKLYYMGPSFRAERPQAGRYRQFHQIGAEFLGAKGAEDDVALLTLMMDLIEGLGVQKHKLEINTLGCKQSREAFQKKLRDYLSKYESKLSEDSKRRLQSNVIRVLDSKDEKDQKIIAEAPTVLDSLSEDSLEHFNQVQEQLKQRNIPFTVNPRIVRGLDYYNDVVFEIVHPELGAQSAIGAGGRYDGLIGELGGHKGTGACGFALGFERMLMALDGEGYFSQNKSSQKSNLVYVCVLGENSEIDEEALKIQTLLRQNDFSVEEISSDRKAIKKHFQIADRLGAAFVIVIGEDEIKQNQLSVKQMETGNQEMVDRAEIVNYLKGK